MVYAKDMSHRIVQDTSTNNLHLGVERDGRWFAACNRRYNVFVWPIEWEQEVGTIECSRCQVRISKY